MWPQGSARGNSVEDGLDRKAALLLYLREILGRALHPECSPCMSVCISLFCPFILYDFS